MGKRFESIRDTGLLVPGPGQYINTRDYVKLRSPSYGFGTSTRNPFGSGKFPTPGPGSYMIPTKIAEVPEFAMPNRKDESKYV